MFHRGSIALAYTVVPRTSARVQSSHKALTLGTRWECFRNRPWYQLTCLLIEFSEPYLSRNQAGDVVLIVEDEPCLGRVPFPIRVDRVEARPHPLGHDLPERCGRVHLRGVVFMIHPRQHLLCSHQLFLRELSSIAVDRDLVIVLDKCRVHRCRPYQSQLRS